MKGNRQPATGNRQPATGNRQPATGNRAALEALFLNLIQSVGSQRPIPYLFLSAKSTPISKWLSKSPLLFKPSLLSKSALFFAPLLLLSYTQDVQALTASTINAIEGSAPYLTFDGGQTKATDTNNLLYIELPDGRTITPSTNTSTYTNPIILPNGNFTFNDIHTVLPSGTTTTGLNSLITQGNWGDDDGDGQGAGGVIASGSISLVIKDSDGTAVNLSDTLSICNAPYKVTLSSTGGNLVTQYGVPNGSTFSGGTADYYITLPSPPIICSVRPNLYVGTGSEAGPSNIWSPTKGFLVQSTSPSSYDLNFPTTGLDGLYFDLDIWGIDASQLSWTVNTSGSLGATVRWTRPRTDSYIDPWTGSTIQHDAWIADKSKYVTRVTLSGPRADSTQINSSNPSSLTHPSLPQVFELVGSDRSGNEVRYGFVLKQWFVHRSNQGKSYSDQLAWCNSLGYRMPRVRDLTNAKCGVDSSFPCVNGIDSATPNSSGNHYKRHIGAGFFTEWGAVLNYADTGFVNNYYWTSDAGDPNEFNVYAYYGDVIIFSGTYYSSSAVCTTP